MPGGRPPKYDPALHLPLAYGLSQSGMNMDKIAALMGIAKSTLYEWMKVNQEFSDAIKTGSQMADEAVEAALYHRAVGYKVRDTEIRQKNGRPVRVTVIRNYPPDTGAAAFWLKNRKAANWKDRREDLPTETDPLNINFNGEASEKDLDPEQNDNLEVSHGRPPEEKP